MNAKGLGGLLVVLGIGSFVLPFMGLQFKLMMIFGNYTWLAGIVAMLLGVTLMIVGKKQ